MDLIVNGSNGMYWYPRGSERLEQSLINVGWNNYKIFNNYPNEYYDKECPYTIKASIIHEVLDSYKYLKKVLWVDCSVWAIKNPQPIFDIIAKDGYYFWSSGFNAAQTCSDKCLDYFNLNRNEAENFEDCCTAIFGFDLDNPVGYLFIKQWLEAAKNKVFHGSRYHDGQSKDKRFLFHRQDQSAATCIIGKSGLKIHKQKEHCMYDVDGEANENIIFKMRGM